MLFAVICPLSLSPPFQPPSPSPAFSPSTLANRHQHRTATIQVSFEDARHRVGRRKQARIQNNVCCFHFIY